MYQNPNKDGCEKDFQNLRYQVLETDHRELAPTNILVAGSTNGQGIGEWVGNLLLLGCVAVGTFGLCINVVWATQEKQVALRSGGHRQIIRICVDENFKTTRRARPRAEEKRNLISVCHNYAEGTQGSGGSGIDTRMPEHDPSSPRLYQSRTTISGPRQWGSALHVHGQRAGYSETSEIPELVTGEDFEATPPYEERLSTSARTRLDRVHMEMVQGGQQ
ncbi:hypothetical protein K438DRAFT_1761196 [Mycena galopus ATCC 62051]|nr:hypothetical protein K438DRAFT_1761196 [Mycena galopus ATCC 62051]